MESEEESEEEEEGRAVVFVAPSSREKRMAGKESWPPTVPSHQWFWLPLLRYAVTGIPCSWCVRLLEHFPGFQDTAVAYSKDFSRRRVGPGTVGSSRVELSVSEVAVLFRPGTISNSIRTRLKRANSPVCALKRCRVPRVVFEQACDFIQAVSGEAWATCGEDDHGDGVDSPDLRRGKRAIKSTRPSPPAPGGHTKRRKSHGNESS